MKKKNKNIINMPKEIINGEFIGKLNPGIIIKKTKKEKKQSNAVDNFITSIGLDKITQYPELLKKLKPGKVIDSTRLNFLIQVAENQKNKKIVNTKNNTIMTPEEYMTAFEKLSKQMVETTRRKNHDYAGSSDALFNFKLIEILTQGKISVEQGIITRITDKLSRIISLLDSEAQVKGESKQDTAIDAAVYFMILAIYMKWKSNNKTN